MGESRLLDWRARPTVATLRDHDLPSFRDRDDLPPVADPVSTDAVPGADHAIPDGPALQFGLDPDRRRMTVRGYIDLANSAALAKAMTTLLDRDMDTVVVDVHDLQFADAASLTLFVAACQSLRDRGVQLRVVGTTPAARQACHAAGLDVLLAED